MVRFLSKLHHSTVLTAVESVEIQTVIDARVRDLLEYIKQFLR